jgi:hypothetical protein
LSEQYDKKAAKDPEDPELMFSYLKSVDPSFKNVKDRSAVDLDFWEEFRGLEFKNRLKDDYKRAQSELVSLVKDDYKKALDLIEEGKLPLILGDLSPVKLSDPQYKDIVSLHSEYKTLSDLLESSADRDIKRETYLRKILKIDEEGEYSKRLRKHYAKFPEVLDQRLEERKAQTLGKLLKYFTDASGNLEVDKLKTYIKAVVDATQKKGKDNAYLAIGKYAA